MPIRTARLYEKSPIERFLPHMLTLCAFLGGMMIKTFSVADQIATKPYVEDHFKNYKVYVDDLSAANLQKAYDHSDMNRQTMLMKLETYSADTKGQGVKIDMILDMLRDSNRSPARSKQ